MKVTIHIPTEARVTVTSAEGSKPYVVLVPMFSGDVCTEIERQIVQATEAIVRQSLRKLEKPAKAA